MIGIEGGALAVVTILSSERHEDRYGERQSTVAGTPGVASGSTVAPTWQFTQAKLLRTQRVQTLERLLHQYVEEPQTPAAQWEGVLTCAEVPWKSWRRRS